MKAPPYTVEDVQELYVSIGEGVWHLQQLEHTVTTFTALKVMQRKREKGVRITEKVGEGILEKQRKLTLGPLIGSARKEKSIPVRLLKRFSSFLDERNWLIHKCVINEHLSLRHESTKISLFNRLEKFAEEAQDLNNEVNSLLEVWYTQKGYDLDYAHKLAEVSIRDAESR